MILPLKRKANRLYHAESQEGAHSSRESDHTGCSENSEGLTLVSTVTVNFQTNKYYPRGCSCMEAHMTKTNSEPHYSAVSAGCPEVICSWSLGSPGSWIMKVKQCA